MRRKSRAAWRLASVAAFLAGGGSLAGQTGEVGSEVPAYADLSVASTSTGPALFAAPGADCAEADRSPAWGATGEPTPVPLSACRSHARLAVQLGEGALIDRIYSVSARPGRNAQRQVSRLGYEVPAPAIQVGEISSAWSLSVTDPSDGHGGPVNREDGEAWRDLLTVGGGVVGSWALAIPTFLYVYHHGPGIKTHGDEGYSPTANAWLLVSGAAGAALGAHTAHSLQGRGGSLQGAIVGSAAATLPFFLGIRDPALPYYMLSLGTLAQALGAWLGVD